MPVADLPYRIERLRKQGQYAYLTRPAVRSKSESQDEEVVAKKKKPATRIRVLRNVNLCDGPNMWLAIQTKREKEGLGDEEPYGFYVALRLFATPSLVTDYLNSPELQSFCSSTNIPVPTLQEEDPVITEDNYLDEISVALTRQEYSRTLSIEDETLESLEEMVCQLRGIDSLESLDKPKRTRRKASDIPPPAPVEPEPAPPVVLPAELSDAEEAADAAIALTTASERPSVPDEQVAAKTPVPRKRKKATLRDQFVLVQKTPSRVIDVSSFGDTMQHQKGRVLDRMKNESRIAQCVSLPDLFPVISDNVQGFERAMASLGSRYTSRVAEFRKLYDQKVKKALTA